MVRTVLTARVTRDSGLKKKEKNQEQEQEEEEEQEEEQETTTTTTTKKKTTSKRKLDSNEDIETKTETSKIKTTTDFTEPKKSDQQLKIISWNVAGFRSCATKGFKAYVESEQPDVICLQETKIKEAVVDEKDMPAGYTRTFIHCTDKPGQHGVAILTKLKPLSITTGISKFKPDNSKHDNEGRVITMEFDNFYLVNSYVPNAGTTGLKRLDYRIKEWDVDFQEYLKELDKTKPIVWCGDLNVAHNEIDLKNPKTNTKSAGFTIEERTSFGNFLNEGFIDSYRHYNPTKEGAYTFWSYKFGARAKNAGWRLDYFVVSKRFIDNIKTPFIRDTVMGSDHAPIGILIDQ